jgi:hypothetical protein
MLARIIPDDVMFDFYFILTVIQQFDVMVDVQFGLSVFALCRYYKIRSNRVLKYHPMWILIAVTARQIYGPNFMNPAKPLFLAEDTPIRTDWVSSG